MTYCFDEKELGEIMKSNRRSMKKSATLLLTILISIFIVSSAQAAFVPISDLPDGQLVIGDKLFSDFEVSGISQGGPPEPSTATVKVDVIDEALLGEDEYGLIFRLAASAGADQLINANINFKVSILPDYSPWLIEDATIMLSNAGATDAGLVTVTEMIYPGPLPMNPLATLNTKSEWDDGGVNLYDSSVLNSQVKEMWVRMGIIVRGGYSSDTGTANLTEIWVIYGQVPEPTTILLLGLGALALLRKRRV